MDTEERRTEVTQPRHVQPPSILVHDPWGRVTLVWPYQTYERPSPQFVRQPNLLQTRPRPERPSAQYVRQLHFLRTSRGPERRPERPSAQYVRQLSFLRHQAKAKTCFGRDARASTRYISRSLIPSKRATLGSIRAAAKLPQHQAKARATFSSIRAGAKLPQHQAKAKTCFGRDVRGEIFVVSGYYVASGADSVHQRSCHRRFPEASEEEASAKEAPKEEATEEEDPEEEAPEEEAQRKKPRRNYCLPTITQASFTRVLNLQSITRLLEPSVKTILSGFSWIRAKMDDGFAQTREPDDLFEDEFTPITEPIPQHIPAPSPLPSQTPQYPRADRSSRARTNGRNLKPGEASREPLSTNIASAAVAVNEPSKENESHAQPQTQAVRGDRSGTGGVRKPKLTEDELSARLEAVKLNNAKREEAHRLAEADEASFQHREQQAQVKRREETAAKRVQDAEREKNRLRKLKAQGGREWDEDKVEQDTTNGRSSQYRRGAHGGVGPYDNNARSDGSRYGDVNQDEEGAGFSPRGGRGRGGRGGRGRGRGRGGYESGGYESARGIPPHRQSISSAPVTSAEKDFPALPGPAGKTSGLESKRAAATASEPVQSPVGEKGSWAEQVEANAPAGGW
ncbi:hypothetical protein LPUS_06679 [Lasallia pustulata]|uniref:Uncharacterized protein n=1 Tax=Lasallia pustulata TaxID=136370 RepID=A0A1W5D252_9LECA|nr:hypothetical protein LPUS_06679 [Lasallia pustulata]